MNKKKLQEIRNNHLMMSGREAIQRILDALLEEEEPAQTTYTQEQIEEMRSLIDGAYEVIELYHIKTKHRSQHEWAAKWLDTARKYGASPE